MRYSFKADKLSDHLHTHIFRISRNTFSLYQGINESVRYTILVSFHTPFVGQHHDNQKHNWNETETIDYQIDYRAVIFPSSLYDFHVYHHIFQPGSEVSVTEMRTTH
jgi:hypothetical protein